MQKDDKFKFVFDFGDDWEFQCRVLRIIDEDTDEAMMIRVVGESPEQYPAYE
ncbi:IS1096 element passenger TnpR family protein [Ruminococcus callidus]|uniref:IS1096 element passenger TnpR family protein n=1 Tax=Ruminococcus callidus TaxID=40519 RepID=UPI0035213BF6